MRRRINVLHVLADAYSLLSTPRMRFSHSRKLYMRNYLSSCPVATKSSMATPVIAYWQLQISTPELQRDQLQLAATRLLPRICRELLQNRYAERYAQTSNRGLIRSSDSFSSLPGALRVPRLARAREHHSDDSYLPRGWYLSSQSKHSFKLLCQMPSRCERFTGAHRAVFRWPLK